MIVRDLIAHANDLSSLSLYIHVPFCSKRCDYCDFYSQTDTDSTLIDGYVHRLIEEISIVTGLYTSPFKSVYIGGGTPGLLGPEHLSHLLDATSRNGRPLETSIEMNPDIIDRELLNSLDGRIDRLSIGVQSLSRENLRCIGRNASLEGTLAGLERVASFGSNRFDLNIDLIDAIPGQKTGDTIEDIDLLFDMLRPAHFSVYDLIIEPGTPLDRRIRKDHTDLQIDRNGNIEMRVDSVKERLSDLGYEQYEVSNYALPGKRCIHNLQYWEMNPYLGIGAGAASTLFSQNLPVRIECRKNVHEYAYQKGCFSDIIYTSHTLDAKEFAEELFIMGLRTVHGISIDRINHIFTADILGILQRSLEKWAEKGCLRDTQSGFIALTDKGLLYMNSILVDLFIDLDTLTGIDSIALDTYF